VAQLSTLGSMSATKTFQQVGAWLCAFLGVWGAAVSVVLARQVTSKSQVLILIPFIFYTLLAFVPFVAFIYPRFKTTRKSVFLGVSLLEILVFGLFLYVILFLRAAA